MKMKIEMIMKKRSKNSPVKKEGKNERKKERKKMSKKNIDKEL